jgi:hypothetical protein
MRPVHFLLYGALLVLPTLVDAQTPQRGAGGGDPRLRIDSPRDGAVVAPGDIMQVAVSSPNGTRFLGIAIVMEDPFDIDQEATSLPAKFAIEIPKTIRPGIYSVSAMAGLAGRGGQAGELVVAIIEVDIERREMPRAIASVGRQVELRKKGQTSHIEVIGEFGNGDFVDVTESTRVTFESSNTAVATVDRSGTITAVGTGQTEVIGWYGPRDSGIRASMTVVVR